MNPTSSVNADGRRLPFRDGEFEIVDADPLLEEHPVLLDELRLLFSSEDEEFLFKS